MGLCSTRQKRESLGVNVPKDFWTIEVEETNGKAIKLIEFRQKKALLIVNVKENTSLSSKSYTELIKLHDKYT